MHGNLIFEKIYNHNRIMSRNISFQLNRNLLQQIHKRLFSNTAEEIQRQSELFSLEQKKQRETVGRVEKIEVHYEGIPENTTLMMNKNISTPYDCAKHMNEVLTNKAAVALLNGNSLWHMHKPIPESCKLELLHYNIPQPGLVNKAFWRTCSFLLGGIANNAFKNKVEVHLHSFPVPNVKSGSFVYDIQLSLDNWVPTQQELRVLSLEMAKFCQQDHKIECLDVGIDFALLMFKNNPHKTKQIPDIAANNADKVTLYRAGQHVDISKGPMVTSTNHLGRITVSNVIKLNTDILGAPVYRFQGVALPKSLILNHFAYSLLEERAKKLNKDAKIPCMQESATEEHNFVAQLAV